MRELFTLLLTLPIHIALRVVGILVTGVRLLLIMAPFLVFVAAVPHVPGLSREVAGLLEIGAAFAGLAFVFWLAASRPPKAGKPSLRYRYARLMGVGRGR